MITSSIPRALSASCLVWWRVQGKGKQNKMYQTRPDGRAKVGERSTSERNIQSDKCQYCEGRLSLITLLSDDPAYQDCPGLPRVRLLRSQVAGALSIAMANLTWKFLQRLTSCSRYPGTCRVDHVGVNAPGRPTILKAEWVDTVSESKTRGL